MANKYVIENRDVFENQTIFKFSDEITLRGWWIIPKFTLKRILTNDSDKLKLIIEYNGIYDKSLLEKDRFIIRINDNENIELEKPKVTRDKYFDHHCNKKRYDECYEYEITKEQLQKICESNSMSIRMGGDTCEYKMKDIYLCRVFYNGVYDSNQYTDAVSYLDSLKSKDEYERNQEKIKKAEKEEAEIQKVRKRVLWVGIFFIIYILYIFFGEP